MKKVFVSSVMREFEAEREATRAAIESIRMTPVMAENFSAKPHSPQVACLEEVRATDIYVAILGKRYGYIAASGKSVTEEEFEEARRLGLPTLFFVARGELDERQADFVRRIGDYQTGHFIGHFANVQQLQTQMTTALHDYVAQTGVATIEPARAQDLVKRVVASKPSHDSMMTVVILPTRQGEEYVSPLDFDHKDFRSSLAQRAMFGVGAILEPEHGYKLAEGKDFARLEQQPARSQLTRAIAVYSDGRIAAQFALGRDDSGSPFSLVRQYVINREEVGDHLTRSLRFAEQFYGALPAAKMLTSFYISLVLQNIQQKYLGSWPAAEPHGISLGMNQIEDPLFVPDAPLRLSRAELLDVSKTKEKLIALLSRTFKAAGREYPT